MKAPDVNKHFIISIVKSSIRILACVIAVICNNWKIIALGLIIAEGLGVLEELL